MTNEDFLNLLKSTTYNYDGFCTIPNYNVFGLTYSKPQYAQKTDVKSIKFDKKFTTVTWKDGTTTRVGCMLEDEYNKYEAFCAALAKRIYGSTSSVKHIVDTKTNKSKLTSNVKNVKRKKPLQKFARLAKIESGLRSVQKKLLVKMQHKNLLKRWLQSNKSWRKNSE